MPLLTLEPPDPQLDLYTYIGQRSCTFKFTLIDGTSGAEIQQLYPYRDSVPTLSHDTGRTIMRQVSNVFFDRIDSAVLNPVRNRVKIEMIIPGRDPYPLGTYLFADQARVESTAGTESNAGLLDQMFVVDQQIERSIGFQNVNAGFAIERVMRGLPVKYTQEVTGFLTIGSWTAGTNRGQVINDLALDADYFAPWFDNTDVMRFIRAFDPATAIPSFNFDVGNRVSRTTVVRTDDLLSAPNRFIVISNGAESDSTSAAPIVGQYDIPSSAPHSIFNRGFVIPHIEDRQVGNTPQAQSVAKNIAQRMTVFERVELETPPDPRHDSYQVFRWQNENWLEISWEMELIEGGKMRHIGRKVYL